MRRFAVFALAALALSSFAAVAQNSAPAKTPSCRQGGDQGAVCRIAHSGNPAHGLEQLELFCRESYRRPTSAPPPTTSWPPA